MLLKLLVRQNLRTYSYAVLFTAATFIMWRNISYVTRKRYEIIYWKPVTPNISCYYSKEDDALPPAEAINISQGVKSIFFHETSCRGGLSSRQACAVESAARAHPYWQVHVLFSSPVTHHVLNNSCVAKLIQFHNVHISRVHAKKFTKDTPLKEIFSRTLKFSKFPIEHASDMLRIVTLNKWGGLYMDLDMVVARSLESLPENWIVRQVKSELATGIMAFANDVIGNNYTADIIRDVAETFDPTEWAYNGPYAISRKIISQCKDFFESEDYKECGGLTVYSRELFYPIMYTHWRMYYEENSKSQREYYKSTYMENPHRPYTHHLWNYFGKDTTIEKHSLYRQLAERYCPTIYDMYGEEFGA